MTWTPDTIAQLRTLWAEGHSTAEIGRRMGVTKNAVVGKAHRIGLLSRPSPLKGDLWTRCPALGISAHATRARVIKLGIPKPCARLAGRSTLPMLPSLRDAEAPI